MPKSIRDLEFPFYKDFQPDSYAKKCFELLKKYKLNIIKSRRIDIFFIVKLDFYSSEEILRLTDIFSEECRVKCNRKDNISVYDYYVNNKEKILKDLEPKNDYLSLDRYMFDNYKKLYCTNFPNLVALQLLRYFKVKNWLDPSAGWGDRLIAALAYGCKYTGVDPNPCMQKYYKEMIDTFGGRKKKNYRVLEKPFEEFEIGDEERPDLIFTSPPFFDFEIYSNHEKQSVVKFKTLEEWIKGFIHILISKSVEYCQDNGHIAFYINNYNGVKFVEKFRAILDKYENIKYLGTVQWIQGSYPKKIFIWKKILI